MISNLIELLFPSNIYCISCGNLIDATRPYALCDHCVRTWNWNNEDCCQKCGKKLRNTDGNKRELCFDCLVAPHAFVKGYSCVEYGWAERDFLHRFKYKDKAYYAKKMADLMAERIDQETLAVDLLVPVPMYKKKQRQRGYNQAAVLARQLGEKLQISYDEVLIRQKNTEPMSGLDRLQRKENIKDAFAVVPSKARKVKGISLMLIDDIYTTGSTADACAQCLINAGAKEVYVYAFAAGADMNRG